MSRNPMNQQKLTPQQSLFLALWCCFVLIACNLGTSSGAAPPVLAPRATATPPPTLGFEGQDSNGQSVTLGNIQTPVSDPAVTMRTLIDQIDRDRLMAHVDAMQGFHTRHVNSTKSSSTRGIGAARIYIKQQFDLIQQQTGNLSPSLHEFTMTYGDVTSVQANVFGVIQGTEPGASTLVIGAHYDSIATADFTNGEIFAPGANDNGTGVAALIELARIMSQGQYRSSIIFVAFSAEEVDRRGSKAFVQFLQQRNIDIVGMINIDTIGNTNDRRGNVADSYLRLFSRGPNNDSPSRLMARTMEFLSFQHDAPLELRMVDSEDREGRYGDHQSFSERGYPAVRVINALEEWGNGSQQDTREYIEPEYFVHAAQSVMVVAVALANGPLPPENISFRTTEQSPALLWEHVPGASGYVIALRIPGQLRYDHHIECVPGDNNCHTDGGTWRFFWSEFVNYEGIAIAARGPDGVLGRLSSEYRIG